MKERIIIKVILSHCSFYYLNKLLAGWKMDNKRILVVDDQFGIRILLNEIFSKEGYDTFSAASGQEALEIVEKKEPHLVLLDMKIPGMDGLEILTRIKEMNEQVKVIIMTAYGELNMINEAMASGAVAYFSKPFDIDEVRITVHKEMQQNGQA